MKATSIEIIEILKGAGHEAYWAGGCVRDMLYGIEPQDFDIVTSARPEEIEDLLEHTIPIGKKFGVILAIQNKHAFEIATFRSDSGYSDGRRPDAVEFTNAEQDALRRDFTINALFYDPLEDKILDFVGGQKDMQESLLRFIGKPEERIEEDNLRLLRAVRFKNNFDLQYHPDTYQAVKKYAAYVKNVSQERIRDELNKMIMGNNPEQAFEELFEMDLLEQIIPEMCKLKGLAQPKQYHNETDVWDHSLRSLKSLTQEEVDPNPLRETPPDLALKWATLLHDIAKFETFTVKNDRITYPSHAEKGADMASAILKRLAFPKSIIRKVDWLIRHHMMLMPLFDMPDGRRRHWFLQPHFEDLLELYRADAMGIVPLDLSAYEKLKQMYRHEIAKLKLMPDQLISGNEVMKILKIKPGKEVGRIIKEIREKQLEGKLKTKKDAISYIKSKLSS
ncbi:HDIG domain-containing protein [Candidatus Peregrinibacteria bacterium]|nr:HDIG domain-containing protein [Candidatus Peregrinibacteria bacterium]